MAWTDVLARLRHRAARWVRGLRLRPRQPLAPRPASDLVLDLDQARRGDDLVVGTWTTVGAVRSVRVEVIRHHGDADSSSLADDLASTLRIDDAAR